MSEQTPFVPPLIVVEGDEGTGKSTVAKLVCNKLEVKGIPVVHTREPGGTALGEALRTQLLMKREKPLDPVTHILMHQAYRKEHVDTVILPALAEGKVVVCERFYYSTLALNIMPYIHDRPELQQLFMDTMPHVAAQIPQPVTFVLDLTDESVRQERIAERNRKKAETNDPELYDAYEMRTPEELQMTSAAYKQFLGDPQVIALDASFEADLLADRIVEQIEAQIKMAKEQSTEFDEAAAKSSPEVTIAGVDTPLVEEPVVEFNLELAVEEFLDEHLVSGLFNHDESQIEPHRPLARAYILTVYDVAKDPIIFEGANRARLRTNMHSIFHFGHQLDLIRNKLTTESIAQTVTV